MCRYERKKFDSQLTEIDICIIENSLDLFISFAQDEIKNIPLKNHKNPLNNISIARDAIKNVKFQKPLSIPQVIIVYNSLLYLRELVISELNSKLSASDRVATLETQKNINSVLRKLKPIYEFANNY